jgi:hypothetical protein
MEGTKEWVNRTNLKHKGAPTYGLPLNRTAISFLKAHEL